MSSNQFFLFDGVLTPWSLEPGTPAPWPDCRYFGEVLTAVDRAAPELGLCFVITDRIDASLPLRGDNVVVICIRDELSRMPSYAHEVRLVAKTYGVRRALDIPKNVWHLPRGLAATLAQEAIVQARRAPTFVASCVRRLRHGKPAVVVDVPVGTYLLEDLPFMPFEERPFDVSYAGSRLNKPEEAYRRVPTRKARSRRELESVLEELVASHPEWRIGIHIIDTFQEAPAHSGVYSRLLMGSRIALCPRGGSLDTYRFFEALRSGCVPITERLPSRDFYTGSPALHVGRWSELPPLLESLLSDADRLQTMHQAVLRWWTETCSATAVAGRILTALEHPAVARSRR